MLPAGWAIPAIWPLALMAVAWLCTAPGISSALMVPPLNRKAWVAELPDVSEYPTIWPAGLIPVVVCTSLSATALGLLVATLARTESQVAAYATFLVITMAGISGCFMPRDWQPQLMRQISLITPHAWALIAYDQLLVREHLNLAVYEFLLVPLSQHSFW